MESSNKQKRIWKEPVGNHSGQNNFFRKYRKEITHFIFGVVGGLIFLFSLYKIARLLHNLIGLNVNLLDPIQHLYTALPLVITGLILWFSDKKFLGIGVILSYPIYFVTISILLTIACTQGNCL